MSEKGGLPAISRYDIERHWYLHELRRLRAVHRLATANVFKREVKEYQKELCIIRKKRNVG